ncbi:hypothetical protein ACQZ5N_25720, partial [Agrobacterium sp. 22-221-1]
MAIFIGVSLLRGYFYPMQKRLPPFLENGPVDVVERSKNGGVAVFFLPHSCACHRNPASPSLWAERTLPAAQTRVDWQLYWRILFSGCPECGFIPEHGVCDDEQFAGDG